MQTGERTETVDGNTDSGNAEAGATATATTTAALPRALNLNSPSYNTRNPAVRRLLHEARELQSATDQFWARPLEDNLFEWHFTIAGPSACEFEGGRYHGRIILPANYPLQPPSFILVTQNGRFETNRKICLSISGHHPETWQPSWSIRTALVALIAFLPTPGAGAIGSLDYPVEERKKLAVKSRQFCCPDCGPVSTHLAKAPPPTSSQTPISSGDNSAKTSSNQAEAPQASEAPSEGAKKASPEKKEEQDSAQQQTDGAGTSLPQFPISFPSLAATSGTIPHFHLAGFTNADSGSNAAVAGPVGMPPPPYVAATYLPYLYQTMFNYASYYAHQAAMAAVIAGAAQQRFVANINNGVAPEPVQPQRQQPENLTPADLIAQQQHRERRASAYLFAIILIAWTITRFLDRFLV